MGPDEGNLRRARATLCHSLDLLSHLVHGHPPAKDALSSVGLVDVLRRCWGPVLREPGALVVALGLLANTFSGCFLVRHAFATEGAPTMLQRVMALAFKVRLKDNPFIFIASLAGYMTIITSTCAKCRLMQLTSFAARVCKKGRAHHAALRQGVAWPRSPRHWLVDHFSNVIFKTSGSCPQISAPFLP